MLRPYKSFNLSLAGGLYRLQLLRSKRRALQGFEVILQLGHAAGTYQNTGHQPVLQQPVQCHLGQALSARCGYLVEGTDALQYLVGQRLLLQMASAGDA